MVNAQWDEAIKAWAGLLGAEHVLASADALKPYLANVGGVERSVPAVLKPSTTEEVEGVVQIANRCLTPLYPISTGRNWGMGSRLPVRDDTAILDLGRMNRIREVNATYHYAVVEPGVTQGQLYDYLVEQELPLVINVTGSARDTSLIGNALDRGVGYFAARAEGLSGLEVVLGSGEVVKTGFAHYENARTAHIYRFGVGPYMDGLFMQSNYGVVTSAGIDLMPRPEASMAVIIKIDAEAKLPDLIDRLAALKRDGIINTVIHVGNRGRTEITLGPLVYRQLAAAGRHDEAVLKQTVVEMLDREGFGPWSAVAGVMGTRAHLKTMRKEINGRLKGLARIMYLTDAKIQRAKQLLGMLEPMGLAKGKREMLSAMEPLFGFTKGIPTDAALDSVDWSAGTFAPNNPRNPDEGHAGLLYVLPYIPIQGEETVRLMEVTRNVFGKYGFEPYVTVNLVDTKAMECVINLAFDRRNTQQAEAAHECISSLNNQFIEAGYPLYRIGIESLERTIDPRDTFWQTAASLKKALDPNHIISPGRYNIV